MNYSIEYHKHNKYLAVIYSSSYINPFDSIKEILKKKFRKTVE